VPIKQKLSCSKIRRIWRTGFYVDRCATVWAVALRRVIFERKKLFETIGLVLIYHPIVLSQPPSRDTVLSV
jgi:hypothetical protein